MGKWRGVGKCGCGLTSVGHLMLAALCQEARQQILSEHWNNFRERPGRTASASIIR